MIIARQVAREVGAALACELRAALATAAPRLPEMLTVHDFAALLRVEPKTVRRWRQEGLLPEALVIGGVIRWRRDAVEGWLQEQETR